MEGIATIVLMVIGLFLVYKTGAMNFLQTSMQTGTKLAEQRLKVMEEDQEAKIKLDLGKIEKKYTEKGAEMSTFKRLKAAKARLDAEAESATV